jgi:hypothetical protein
MQLSDIKGVRAGLLYSGAKGRDPAGMIEERKPEGEGAGDAAPSDAAEAAETAAAAGPADDAPAVAVAADAASPPARVGGQEPPSKAMEWGAALVLMILIAGIFYVFATFLR